MVQLRKDMLDSRPCFGYAAVACLLAFAQRLEHSTARFAGVVAPVGVHIGAGVVLIEHFIKVGAVVLAGCARDDLAHKFVFDIDRDAELVAVVALAMLLGLGGIQSFCLRLAALQFSGVLPSSNWALSSLLKCGMGAGTKVASMICPQRAR